MCIKINKIFIGIFIYYFCKIFIYDVIYCYIVVKLCYMDELFKFVLCDWSLVKVVFLKILCLGLC